MPADKKEREALFDVRVVKRNLEKGAITEKEYEKLLADLEDASDKAAKPSADEDEE